MIQKKPFLYCLISLAVLPFLSVAQSNIEKNELIYFNSKWEETTRKDSAKFYRLPRVLTDSGYRVCDYFMNGKLQMKGYATTPGAAINTGNYVYYDSLGNKKREGVYSKGMMTGLWTYYFKGTEIISAQINFYHDKHNGHSIYYDSSSHLILNESDWINGNKDGESRTYHRGTNKLYIVSHWKDGKKDGLSEFYFSNGQVKRREFFKANELLPDHHCYDINGKELEYFRFVTDPKPLVDVEKKFYQEIEFPQLKRENPFTGEIKFSMRLDAEGSQIECKVVGEQSSELSTYVLNFLKKLKRWQPMEFDGRAVETVGRGTFVFGERSGFHLEFKPIESQIEEAQKD